MTETIITLDDINPIDFLGVNNGKLNLLKKRFPLIKILSRGSQLKLNGTDEHIKEAQLVIQYIVSYVKRTGSLSTTELEEILGNESIGDNSSPTKNFPSDTILFCPNGKAIRARTQNQKILIEAVDKNVIIFAIGPAGTGKTYTAVALAVRALKNKQVKKIILTRPAVEAGESLGFLPGDLKEKIDPYLRPLYDALDDMIPSDKLNYFMTTGTVEIAPLAYMRGRTLDNAFIILDEAQNSNELQLKMFLTRIGASAKAVITGDPTQIDLPKNQPSGLEKTISILKDIEGIVAVKLTEADVVRHRLVRDIIKAYDKAGSANKNK